MIRQPTDHQLPTVLITGFDAFGGDTVNPSWLVAQALDGEIIQGHRIVAAQLPTEFVTSRKVLAGLLRKHRPALVLCLGLAGGRARLSLERVAINVQDARIADNAGAQPIDQRIIARGPAAYFSTLPIKAMLQAIEAEGVPAEISQTAGTFVCNHIFYALMHHLTISVRQSPRSSRPPRGGFIHVPYLPVQGTPYLPLDDMVRGLRAACACALTTDKDLAHGAGALN
jgi:pyroglutamyl-peptidase